MWQIMSGYPTGQLCVATVSEYQTGQLGVITVNVHQAIHRLGIRTWCAYIINVRQVLGS